MKIVSATDIVNIYLTIFQVNSFSSVMVINISHQFIPLFVCLKNETNYMCVISIHFTNHKFV